VLTFSEEGKPENRKTGEPGKNPRRKAGTTTNSTHICHQTGIEPRPHWWEARALTTAPSLLVIANSNKH